MKFVYGLEVDNEDLAIWHALHGGGVYDDLYYLKGVHDSGVPYIVGREYQDITLILGRRTAKSCIGAFISSYELLCGGHQQRLAIQDQEPIFLHVAQDLGQAMSCMRQYTLYYLKSSPAGRQQLGDLQQSVTQKTIRLKGCGLIRVGPPNIKVGRGDSIPCAILDELAYWQSDEKSAAPDFEVEAAIEYSMGQFSPYDKRLKLSTPFTEEGLLWKMRGVGTHGRHLESADEREANSHTLVLQGPSPVLENPSITRKWLMGKKAKDPEKFRREIGAEFAKAVSGYLSPALIDKAMEKAPTDRPFQPGIHYVAAMDPATKGDSWPICIGHLEGDGEFVLDYLDSWQGTKDEPINPGVIIPLIGAVLQRYGIRSVMTDQHHSTSLQALADLCDPPFNAEEFVLTNASKNKVWTDTLNLFTQGKMHLLRHPQLKSELLALERTLSKATKAQRIGGKRDDHAMVLAMACHRALQFGICATKTEKPPEQTTPEGIRAVQNLRFKGCFGPVKKRSVWWRR